MAIHRSDLDKLARMHALPAVSLLFGTDRRRPGNGEDVLRLRGLVGEARRRLHDAYGLDDASPLVARLQHVSEHVDWMHPEDGVAIFVTADEQFVFPLPFAVDDHVVVEETFATRTLLRAVQRADRYRVLVLSGHRSRLFEGFDAKLHEVSEGSFPVEVEAPLEEDTPHRDLPPHERRRDADHHFVFRAVDRALHERSAADPLPVIVVAVERDLAFFDEVTTHGATIVDRITGDHSRDDALDIARLVAPVAQAHFDRRRTDAVGEVERAVGAKRAALGVHDAWAPALGGRGRLLVVEDDYVFPGHVVGDELVAGAGPSRAGRLDDAVDELIEAVMTHGGDAVLVGPGGLGEYGPVALVLRY